MSKHQLPKPTEPETKQYSLKEIELRVIANINSRANAEMLDFLSFVSLERLAYDVTEHTQFSVQDGKLLITEVVPEEPTKEEVAVA